MKNNVVKNQAKTAPFIKWVGGKRQLLHELKKYVPAQYKTYFEPFIGGGALLFDLEPTNAVINDYNFELYNAYQMVKNNPTELINYLQNHETNDTKDYYLDLRYADRDGRLDKMNDTERAARFIYLVKAGFNGLWRVNKKGQNNVPYGGHKSLNLVTDNLINDIQYLQHNNVKIKCGDYKAAVQDAQADDFVYLDPPYIPLTLTSSFTSYTNVGFGLKQQEELATLAQELSDKGVKVMLSNSDVPLIRQLYPSDTFNIHVVQARRAINSNGKKRGKVGEVIITNY